jgi:hypothetical protein
MGYIAALTRSGSPSVDLMAATPDGQNTLAIQVKTASYAYRPAKKQPENTYWCWQVSSKIREVRGESVLYVFVDLNRDSQDPSKTPDVFVVPSSDIREVNLSDTPKGLWFIITKEDEERKWHRNDWHLIEERLPLPKG